MRVDFVSRGVFRNRFDSEFVFRQSSVEAEPLTHALFCRDCACEVPLCGLLCENVDKSMWNVRIGGWSSIV